MLSSIDRRWIFVTIFVAAIVPMIWPLNQPIKPTATVVSMYQAIDRLPPGSTVFAGFDYEPASEVELTPAALAMIHHLWSRDIKLIGFTLWPAGTSESTEVFRLATEEAKAAGHPKQYGVDYINLGYKAGNQVVIKLMSTNLREPFPRDINDKPLDSYPIMQHIYKISDAPMVISFSVGMPGLKEYVQYLSGQGVLIGGACTAVNLPELQPYLQSKQLVGLLGGLRGAADYETLIGMPGDATKGMSVQSVVHCVIALFIVLANVAYFADRRRDPRFR
jgi:hypothetical protein